MGKIKKIKENLKMIDYLKEQGIEYDDLKIMIEESVDTALENVEEEGNEEVEQTEESESEPEEVPSFTKEDVKELIADEVKRSLKIKRKVPSKGTLTKEKPKEVSIKKNWFEIVV